MVNHIGPMLHLCNILSTTSYPPMGLGKQFTENNSPKAIDRTENLSNGKLIELKNDRMEKSEMLNLKLSYVFFKQTS